MEALLGGMLEAVEMICLVGLPRFWKELLDKASQIQVVPEPVPKR